jgi:broad-specificity NMP kinase
VIYGETPTVILGGLPDLKMLVTASPADTCIVLVRCHREETKRRLQQRGSSPTDLTKRLEAWRVFEEELSASEFFRADLILDTAVLGPTEAARRIDAAVDRTVSQEGRT